MANNHVYDENCPECEPEVENNDKYTMIVEFSTSDTTPEVVISDMVRIVESTFPYMVDNVAVRVT